MCNHSLCNLDTSNLHETTTALATQAFTLSFQILGPLINGWIITAQPDMSQQRKLPVPARPVQMLLIIANWIIFIIFALHGALHEHTSVWSMLLTLLLEVYGFISTYTNIILICTAVAKFKQEWCLDNGQKENMTNENSITQSKQLLAGYRNLKACLSPALFAILSLHTVLAILATWRIIIFSKAGHYGKVPNVLLYNVHEYQLIFLLAHVASDVFETVQENIQHYW